MKKTLFASFLSSLVSLFFLFPVLLVSQEAPSGQTQKDHSKQNEENKESEAKYSTWRDIPKLLTKRKMYSEDDFKGSYFVELVFYGRGRSSTIIPIPYTSWKIAEDVDAEVNSSDKFRRLRGNPTIRFGITTGGEAEGKGVLEEDRKYKLFYGKKQQKVISIPSIDEMKSNDQNVTYIPVELKPWREKPPGERRRQEQRERKHGYPQLTIHHFPGTKGGNTLTVIYETKNRRTSIEFQEEGPTTLRIAIGKSGSVQKFLGGQFLIYRNIVNREDRPPARALRYFKNKVQNPTFDLRKDQGQFTLKDEEIVRETLDITRYLEGNSSNVHSVSLQLPDASRRRHPENGIEVFTTYKLWKGILEAVPIEAPSGTYKLICTRKVMQNDEPRIQTKRVTLDRQFKWPPQEQEDNTK